VQDSQLQQSVAIPVLLIKVECKERAGV
jgi:hypothetical protein